MEDGPVLVYNLAIGVIFTCHTAQKGSLPTLCRHPFSPFSREISLLCSLQTGPKIAFPPLFGTTHKWRHTLEGGCPKCDDSTDRLREWDSDKEGERVQKCKIFVWHHLWMVLFIAAPVARVIYHIFHLRTDFLGGPHRHCNGHHEKEVEQPWQIRVRMNFPSLTCMDGLAWLCAIRHRSWSSARSQFQLMVLSVWHCLDTGMAPHSP